MKFGTGADLRLSGRKKTFLDHWVKQYRHGCATCRPASNYSKNRKHCMLLPVQCNARHWTGYKITCASFCTSVYVSVTLSIQQSLYCSISSPRHQYRSIYATKFGSLGLCKLPRPRSYSPSLWKLSLRMRSDWLSVFVIFVCYLRLHFEHDFRQIWNRDTLPNLQEQAVCDSDTTRISSQCSRISVFWRFTEYPSKRAFLSIFTKLDDVVYNIVRLTIIEHSCSVIRWRAEE